MAFISVIIPTYNRASLLRTAIESILRQSFEDFELVISNGGSTDATREIVGAYRDRRIRYLESSRRLTAAQNYQQGLDAAKGDFITFLSDDDVYCSDLFQTALRVAEQTGAEIIGYPFARYYQSPLFDFDSWISANSLLAGRNSGKVSTFEKEAAIEQAIAAAGISESEQDAAFVLPYLSNAIYRRSVFEKIMAKRQKVFDFVPPDMYLTFAVFFNSDRYACIDYDLLLWRNWEANYTASATRRSSDLRHHYREKFKGREFKFSPLKFPLAVTCGGECALYALHDFYGRLDCISWTQYFKTVYENLLFLRANGIDVSVEMAEFDLALASQPPEIILAVDDFRKNKIRRLKHLLNRSMPKFASMIRRFVRRMQSPQHFVYRGSLHDFSDITEAADFLTRIRDRKN